MTWLHVATVAFAAPVFALTPGALLAAHFSSFNEEERTADAGGFGLAVLGASAFVARAGQDCPVATPGLACRWNPSRAASRACCKGRESER